MKKPHLTKSHKHGEETAKGQAQNQHSSAALFVPEDAILTMQHTIGNRAVHQFLRARDDSSTIIQPAMRITSPGDLFEREAEHLANRVVDSEKPVAQEYGQEKRISEASTQAKPNQVRSFVPIHQVDKSSHTGMRTPTDIVPGSGESLAAPVQSSMEAAFDNDFSHVRLHHNQKAGQIAHALNARAFTVGKHIIFAPGQYAPETKQGQKLLAHELVHTLQQRAGAGMRAGASLTRDHSVSLSSSTVQREAESDSPSLPGNQYEFKFEKKGGERLSYSLRITLSRPEPNPLTTEIGPVKLQLGEAKLSATKTAGKDVAYSMATAVAKADWTVLELMPGVAIDAGIKVLEAKLEQGDVDVDVLKLGIAVKGKLTKAIQSTVLGEKILETEIGQRIKEGLEVKVEGKVEVKVDPADALRLARMVKLNRAIAENTKQAVADRRVREKLQQENKKIRDDLRKRGRKLKKAARKQLRERLKRNGGKIKSLSAKILESKKATTVLRQTYVSTAQGLKSKAGRLLGNVVKRAGGRLLLRLIPGVNIVLTAIDIFQVSRGIYRLLTGKAKLGFPGEEQGESQDEQQSHTDHTTAESNGSDVGKLETEVLAVETRAGTPTDAGVAPIAGVAQEQDDLSLGPEIDISEHLEYRPVSGLVAQEDGQEAVPELHPAALAVWQTIRSREGAGIKFTPADLVDLNTIVPADLDGEELNVLLKHLEQKDGQQVTDVFALLGGIQDYVHQLRHPAAVMTTTVTTTTGLTTESVEEKVETLTVSSPESKTTVEIERAKRQKAIEDFLAEAIPQIQNGGHFGRIDPVLMKHVEKGKTLHGLLAINAEGAILWGFATMVITEVIDSDKDHIRVRLIRLPMQVFDPAGTRLGTLGQTDFETVLH
jgi:hypothetical protein